MPNINSRSTDPREKEMLDQAVTCKKQKRKEKLPLRHNVKTTSHTGRVFVNAVGDSTELDGFTSSTKAKDC